MPENNLDQIFDFIPVINTERKYWRLRTMGGIFYDDFIENDFVAIGYNKIPVEEITKAHKDMYSIDKLNFFISKKLPNEQRPGYISRQLLDFAYGIQKGDIVLVPGYGSNFFSIGMIVDNGPYVVDLPNEIPNYKCPFTKRRKVRWLENNINLVQMDTNLLPLKYVHQALTEIDERYIPLIDRAIDPLFIKDGRGHLLIRVNRDEPISAELFETWDQLFTLAEEIGNENGIKLKKSDFQIKINVQSFGYAEIITVIIPAIIVLGGLIFGLKYDGFAGKIDFKGILKGVNESMKDKKRIKILEELSKKVKKIDMDADGVKKIIEALDDDNNEK